jgi:methyl-accepting chemotaxis protein
VQQLAAGDFSHPVVVSKRRDEIGSLQKSFHAMQQAIISKIDEIQQHSQKLNKQKETLFAAYDRTHEAERIKTVFLHNVTSQLVEPVNGISDIVNNIKTNHDTLKQKDISQMAKQMQTYTNTIINLLHEMIKVSENDSKL